MTVRFQTTVNNGTISIPKELLDELGDANEVEVEVSTKHADKKHEPYDIISELKKNPIRDPDFVPFKRDEIYDRTLLAKYPLSFWDA